MTALIIALLIALTTPCATEDSTACYWDASQRGNGTGHSFIAVTDSIRIAL